MSDAQPDSSINASDDSASSSGSRQTRRTRRIVIIGVLALVVIGGGIAVGTQVTGSRGGYAASGIWCQKYPGNTQITTTSADVDYVTFTWTDAGGNQMDSHSWTTRPTDGIFTYSTGYNSAVVYVKWGTSSTAWQAKNVGCS